TDQVPLQKRDRIVRIGDHRVEDWPQMLRCMRLLREDEDPALRKTDDRQELDSAKENRIVFQGEKLIRVSYKRGDAEEAASVWVKLAHPQLDTLVPTVLWFFIKAGLFVVGALVLWKRPGE